MHNLTKEEKTILIFIITSLALGLGILHFKRTNFYKENVSLKLDKTVGQIKKEIEESKQVNINKATAGELTKLHGIGEVLAKRIVDYRDTHGDFITKEDIKKVKGIGPKKYEDMKDFLLMQ